MSKSSGFFVKSNGSNDRLILLITGPTASGKSALALSLARELNGIIVNADAMQIYRELPLLTAQPSADEQDAVPHYLYGILAASDPCSAARWRELALAVLKEEDDNRVPIVVGGSGLYLNALIYGLSPIPDIPAEIRVAATSLHKKLGSEGFHQLLATRDPVIASRLPPGDTQRMIRAWEVFEATGTPLSYWQRIPRQGPPPGCRLFVLALLPPREDLVVAIEQRLRIIALGALSEVSVMVDINTDLPLRRAVAVSEFLAARAGIISLEQAIVAATVSTRRYAKRQLTWIRHQVNPDMVIAQRCDAINVDNTTLTTMRLLEEAWFVVNSDC